jgi:CubicO group peptidase (beta-lactamase class C family)
MFYEKELDIVRHEIMTGWDRPGLAVGIVESDKIVYAKGFGVQNLETQTPVKLDTVFCAQSVSKCFVATAIMQLAERGKLDLDAPLIQYLPYYPMNDERYRQITIRQALNHTSGMPDIDESDYIEWVYHPEYDDGAAERFVRSLRDRTLIANPGESFSYSNIAYNVLGDVLATVTDNSFERVMLEQVLTPSWMTNSTFLLADVPTNVLAGPHFRSPNMKINPIYPYHRADAPASFLHTTVVEMCHWCITSLNRGHYLGQSILSPASYELMWKPVSKRGNPPSMVEEMGLGWNLGHLGNQKTISHGGGGFGWTAFLLILPEKNRAVVILCNEESNAHIIAVCAVAHTLIDHKP